MTIEWTLVALAFLFGGLTLFTIWVQTSHDKRHKKDDDEL